MLRRAPFLLPFLLLFSPPSARCLERVSVGAYIHDIQNLDLKSHSYSVDLYLWFRWRNPVLDPASSFEFVNPYELWGHVKTAEYEKVVLPNGERYQVVRNQGRFSRKLLLDDYPFDRQALTVEFEDSNLGAQDLLFVPDEGGIAVNPALELPGFTVGRPELSVVQGSYPTHFGDPRQGRETTYSRVRITVPIARPIPTYSIKLLLPILCVIFCAALMFLFNPRYVDARVGIGITALLTIVALQITLNEDLPEIAYLVLMDKIYLGAYLFVISGLAVVVKTTWMIEKGDMPGAARLNRLSLVALSALYGAATAALIALSL